MRGWLRQREVLGAEGGRAVRTGVRSGVLRGGGRCSCSLGLLAVVLAGVLPGSGAFSARPESFRAAAGAAGSVGPSSSCGSGRVAIGRPSGLVFPGVCGFVFRQSKASMGSAPSTRMSSEEGSVSERRAVEPRVYKRSTVEGVFSYLNLLPGDRRILLNKSTGAGAALVKGDDDQGAKAAETLRKQITAIFGQYVNEDGTGVDYDAVRTSDEFADYCVTAEKLTFVEVEQLSRDEKLAFFINIYNSLVIHAIIILGKPADLLSRLRLYAVASYSIGGNTYSLNEIENGVLRGNKKTPSLALTARNTFGQNDPRLMHAMEKPDPRIHFALNCGAKGCPPIRFYKAANIDMALSTATKAYLKSTEVDETLKELQVSKLFDWYEKDFIPESGGKSKEEELVAWILPFLDDEKTEQVSRLQQGGNFKITYQPYDWGLNNK